MDSILMLVIVALVSALVSTGLGIFIYSRLSVKPMVEREKTIATLQADLNDQTKIDEALRVYKASPDFDSVKKEAFLMGKEEGRIEERLRFGVKVSPYKKVEKGFFKSSTQIGYQVQAMYDNHEVGEPKVCITDTTTEVDKELILKLIEKAEGLAIQAISQYAARGATVVAQGLSQGFAEAVKAARRN